MGGRLALWETSRTISILSCPTGGARLEFWLPLPMDIFPLNLSLMSCLGFRVALACSRCRKFGILLLLPRLRLSHGWCFWVSRTPWTFFSKDGSFSLDMSLVWSMCQFLNVGLFCFYLGCFAALLLVIIIFLLCLINFDRNS